MDNKNLKKNNEFNVVIPNKGINSVLHITYGEYLR